MIFGLNLVDWLVIVLALVVTYTGWVHGFVVGLLSFVGFVEERLPACFSYRWYSAVWSRAWESLCWPC